MTLLMGRPINSEAQSTTNLITNSSFNNGAGWALGQGSSQDNSVSRLPGSGSLRVSNLSANSSQAPILKPNTLYSYSYWIKAQNVVGQGGVARFIQSTPSILVLAQAEYVKGSSEWQQIKGSFNTPVNYQSGRLELLYKLNNGDVLWYDDIILCEGDVNCVTALTPSIVPNRLGDIDGDGDVDIFDYNQLLTDFGKTGADLVADLDKNNSSSNKVDIFDYNTLLTNFGK